MNSNLQKLFCEFKNEIIEVLNEIDRLREDNRQSIEQMNNGTQLKPDWKDAPEWANWLAQDRSGEWYWYVNKPSRKDNCWVVEDDGYEYMLACVNDWEDTLEFRPKGDIMMKNNNDTQNKAKLPKPDWKDAPVWANWLAQDEIGLWYWFERMPIKRKSIWGDNYGKYAHASVHGWENTLEQRPETK